jgi:hypothetical protein
LIVPYTRNHRSLLPPAMKLTALATGLVALFAGHASATALTYKLVANEKACFYANNQEKGQKIAFYFAVRPIPKSWRPRKASC